MNFSKLVFEDHFDKDTIDRNTWGNEVGFVRNNEPQYYTLEDKNAYIKDSNLVIATLREEYEGAHFTSASLHTAGKRE